MQSNVLVSPFMPIIHNPFLLQQVIDHAALLFYFACNTLLLALLLLYYCMVLISTNHLCNIDCILAKTFMIITAFILLNMLFRHYNAIFGIGHLLLHWNVLPMLSFHFSVSLWCFNWPNVLNFLPIKNRREFVLLQLIEVSLNACYNKGLGKLLTPTIVGMLISP